MKKQFYTRYFEADKGTSTGAPVEPAADEQPFKVFNSQSEFDSFIDQRLDKAREKWSADNKSAVDDAVQEALRQAQLSEEEKNNEAAAERDAELAKLREQVALNERRAVALTKLADANLDAALINALNLSSDEALDNSLSALSAVIPAAIQSGIEARISESVSTPAKATSTGATVDDIMSIKDTGERLKAIAANQNLFTKQ